jgi:hypothetical protein
MKFFLIYSVVSITSTTAFSSSCYLYDSWDNNISTYPCAEIDISQARDDGYTVFDDRSTFFRRGCLMAYSGDELLGRENSESVCEQGLDEGWIVKGEVE